MTMIDIAVLDDDFGVLTVLQEALSSEGWRVTCYSSLAEMLSSCGHSKVQLLISDVMIKGVNAFDEMATIRRTVGDIPLIVMSAHNTLTTAMQSSEAGAVDYLAKPFDLDTLIGTVKKFLPSEHEKGSDPVLGQDNSMLIGRSAVMQKLYRDMARTAQSDLGVLLTGESGTGKELVARALHLHGSRRLKPFVSLNMAAIPKDLIESELFGHKKGAFTGAISDYQGRFREADQGTLFLDEIGDMPLETQSRLLRVLQENEFRAVGGDRIEAVNVRIIAATHQDLRQRINQNLFREDLFYRLNIIPLEIPPLRQRLDDIPQLVTHFSSKQAASIRFDDGAIEALKNHSWPGNVRELENLIQRLVILAPHSVISADIIIDALRDQGAGFGSDNEIKSGNLREAISYHLDQYFNLHEACLPPDGLYSRLIKEFEIPLIERCMIASGGNQVKTAKLLGINRNTLRQRIRDLNIDLKSNK